MRLEMQIDREGPEPVFRQIAEAVRTRILAGDLPPGHRLPTIRALAKGLGVANQTAVSAYRLLTEWGMLEATVGSGTFVTQNLPTGATKLRLEQLLGSGPIAEFEAMSAASGIRSLATAVPDPSFFHADEFLAECLALRGASPWAFYYAPPAGMPELRAALAHLEVTRSRTAVEEDVLVTSGALNGLALVVDELCAKGDRILLESPGFLGADRFFGCRGIEVTRVRIGANGLDLDDLLAKAKGARLLLCHPSFGPATGRTMPAQDRQELLDIAGRKGIVVVEDSHYAPISFAGHLPSLSSMGKDATVVQIDSLSGYLSPGLRIGWIRCSPDLRNRLAERIRWSGSAGASFVQLATAAFLEAGRLTQHLRRAVPRYRSRRDAMVSALRLHLPQARFSVPDGGLSVCVDLPEGTDTDRLYAQSVELGVPFAPSSAFGRSESPSSLRLSYGTQEPEAITKAVAVLARIVK